MRGRVYRNSYACCVCTHVEPASNTMLQRRAGHRQLTSAG